MYHYHPKHKYNDRGSGSIGWKLNKDSVVLLGGTRAVLVQIAHPLIAMAVSEHSDYMTDPFGRAGRTFILGEILTFGSKEKAGKFMGLNGMRAVKLSLIYPQRG